MLNFVLMRSAFCRGVAWSWLRLSLAAATSCFPRFRVKKYGCVTPSFVRDPWNELILSRLRRGYKDRQTKTSRGKITMVLTKAYLRYVQSACFGVVCSLKANVVFIRKRTSNSKEQVIQYAACPALESVIVWDVRRGEKASILNKFEVLDRPRCSRTPLKKTLSRPYKVSVLLGCPY